MLSLIGLRDMDRSLAPLPGGPDVRAAADSSDVHRILPRERVKHAFADYWIVYKATFDTDERVIVTSLGTIPYRPHHKAVRFAPRPAHVFLAQSPAYAQFPELCREKGIALRTAEQDEFAVAVPSPKLLPEEEVGEAWHLE